MNYQLELKQIVEFPRCRIYRDFIQTLISDKSIRTNGRSFLFYYLVLCSYANYRTSYRRLEHLVYTVGPGEWICPLKELQSWFRCKFQHQVISILQNFEEQHYISYTIMEKDKIVKFRILDWNSDNTILEYNYPCKKDAGFFFFPIVRVHELIGMGKCSEMDVLLDLWIHAVYNDTSVMGSDSGPVVYFRNNTGNPLTSFQTLADRWGQSKASVSRLLKKLEEKGLITLISFKGKYGSMIYLKNYLSVMFDISDVMIDKEEIAMKMQLPIHIPEEEESSCVPENVTDEQITVSKNDSCVPESHMKFIIKKVAELLNTQGIPCCHCQETQYILSPLSACKELYTTFTLDIICHFGNVKYCFELSLSPGDTSPIWPEQMDAVSLKSKGGE
ncbi:MAG: helix-turn-helix domain-containing protein [Eubacteriales bacterium]|nr:helix-turn-helix domain-containing protein [Eubacteriales bacterium]